MTAVSTRSPSELASSARLAVRVEPAKGSFVDGGWWPRSYDLRVELPPLLAALWARGGHFEHVSYNLSFWMPAPRRLEVEERRIRLGGFHHHDPHLLSLVDIWGKERLDLVIIAPETDPVVALRALRLAADPKQRLRASEVLAAAEHGAVPLERSMDDQAILAWVNEGGRRTGRSWARRE